MYYIYIIYNTNIYINARRVHTHIYIHIYYIEQKIFNKQKITLVRIKNDFQFR